MLLKLDFVTNSSSTSYVVFIPNNFIFDRDKLEQATENFYNFDVENINNEFIGKFNQILNNVKENGGVLTQEDWNGIEEKAVAAYLVDFLPKEYILSSFDTQSEQGYVIVLDKKRIKNLLEKDI